MAKSIEQQIEVLKQAASPRLVTGVEAILLLLGIAAVAYDFRSTFTGIGLFFIAGFVMLSIGRREYARYARTALQALGAGKGVAGTVRIEVTTSDDWKYYRASVTDMNGIDWTLAIKPLEWEPQEGECAAQIYFIDPANGPVLAMTEAGILLPTRKPKRVKANGNRVGPLVLALLCLGIAGLLIVGNWRSYLRSIDAPTAVIVTDAFVVAKDYLRAKPGESHGLKYQFALPDGRVVEGRWMDEDKRWKVFRVGDRIRVQHVADNPERNCPEGACDLTPGLSGAIILSAFGVPFLLIGVFLLIRIIRRP